MDRAGLLERLKTEVISRYNAELWEALRAGLAVICSLSLKNRSNPVALIYEGPSGRGKSTVINMCEPDRPETRKVLFRLDTFTPKSFVSHAANVSREDLEKNDLLPQLKQKTLLTKELAPLFRGTENALRENFAMLTAVLDGRGHRSASGVHGPRGYEGAHVFNWLGATTPIPSRTDAVMAQLGNRMVRYEIVGQEAEDEDLIAFVESYQPAIIEDKCRAMVNALIAEHFKEFGGDTFDPQQILIPQEVKVQFINLARLTACGRVELEACGTGEDEQYVAGVPEGPQRIILILRSIALGQALLESKGDLNPEIMNTIRHICFSSIPRNRRQLLRAVLITGGHLSSKEASRILRVSLPTARRFMRELAATGIVDLQSGAGNIPDRVKLAEKWQWLIGREPIADDGQFDPAENEMEVCVG